MSEQDSLFYPAGGQDSLLISDQTVAMWLCGDMIRHDQTVLGSILGIVTCQILGIK